MLILDLDAWVVLIETLYEKHQADKNVSVANSATIFSGTSLTLQVHRILKLHFFIIC